MAYIGWERSDTEDHRRVEFTWEGMDEMEPATGRGWVRIEADGSMFGRFVIHRGERSWFRGVREG